MNSVGAHTAEITAKMLATQRSRSFEVHRKGGLKMKLTTENGVLKKEIGHKRGLTLPNVLKKGVLKFTAKKGGLSQPNVLKRGS